MKLQTSLLPLYFLLQMCTNYKNDQIDHVKSGKFSSLYIGLFFLRPSDIIKSYPYWHNNFSNNFQLPVTLTFEERDFSFLLFLIKAHIGCFFSLSISHLHTITTRKKVLIMLKIKINSTSCCISHLGHYVGLICISTYTPVICFKSSL